MKELLVRTGTGITLVVLFVGSILAGLHSMALMMMVIYLLGSRELLRAASTERKGPYTIPLVSGAVMIGSTYFALAWGLNPLWLLAPMTLWLAAYTMKPLRENLLLMFWLALPLSSFLGLGALKGEAFSPVFPASVIALVWISDTFSYLCGRLLGKHPFTPVLSPGKTWEGFLGGVLFTTLSGWIFFRITGSYTPFTWVLSAFLVSLLGVAGDLFESQLKRKYGIKDMGSILPGHGGILDRFDSLFFVAPAVFLLLFILDLLT